MFGCFLGWYIICTFSLALAPDGILPCAKFILRYVQVLRSPILAALLHGTPPASVSQAATWYNAITELSQRAPPIFDWVA